MIDSCDVKQRAGRFDVYLQYDVAIDIMYSSPSVFMFNQITVYQVHKR